MDLAVIIVNWNSTTYVRKCLATLAEQPMRPRCEIVVVDNASFDGCGEMLACEFPDVRFVQSDTNLGFGGANNLGAALTTAEILLFLNPDTEVQGRALDLMYAAISAAPGIGALGCRLLNTDGTLQTSCIQSFPTVLNQVVDSDILRRWFPNWRLWGTRALASTSAFPIPVEAVSGACLMVTRAAFLRVSGFSERYFMYGEDMDLSWRLQAAGMSNHYLPSARVVHHGGGSTRQARSTFSTQTMRRSIAEFLRVSQGPAAADHYRLAMGVSALARLGLLGAQLPIRALLGDIAGWSRSARKWTAILAWAWCSKAAEGQSKASTTCVLSGGSKAGS